MVSLKFSDIGIDEASKANTEEGAKDYRSLAKGCLDFSPAYVSNLHSTAMLHSKYGLHEHE